MDSISFYRRATISKKLIFQKINIPDYLLFLESYLFRAATFQRTLPSVAATFSEEVLSHNILFQKSCSFTAPPSLHNYTYYLSVSI